MLSGGCCWPLLSLPSFLPSYLSIPHSNCRWGEEIVRRLIYWSELSLFTNDWLKNVFISIGSYFVDAQLWSRSSSDLLIGHYFRCVPIRSSFCARKSCSLSIETSYLSDLSTSLIINFLFSITHLRTNACQNTLLFFYQITLLWVSTHLATVISCTPLFLSDGW